MLTRNFYLAFTIFLFLLGCDKPDTAPELRDPVYQDLKAEQEKAKKGVEAKVKELEGYKKTYEELLDSDYQKKLTREDMYRTKGEIKKLEQLEEYYKVSAESRQIYSRKQYLEFYKAGKGGEWPPNGLKEKYESQKRISLGSRVWSRGTASAKPKKEEKKSEGEHH